VPRARKVPRRILPGGLAFAAVLGICGCNTSALTKQELVVVFDDDATQAEHAAALQACAHVSSLAIPEPFHTSSLPSDDVGDVRFRTDHANDKVIAMLEACLEKQPGVKGFNTPDMTD
jgi:hypothetical protein